MITRVEAVYMLHRSVIDEKDKKVYEVDMDNHRIIEHTLKGLFICPKGEDDMFDFENIEAIVEDDRHINIKLLCQTEVEAKIYHNALIDRQIIELNNLKM